MEEGPWRVGSSHTTRRASANDVPQTRAHLDSGQIRVDDSDTFAADPGMALSWGRNKLSLEHIASLAASLRGSFPAADFGTLGKSTLTLPTAVKAWVGAYTGGSRVIGIETENELPPSWTVEAGGYVDSVCEAVMRGAPADSFIWRRC